jgi:hypothetical protein
MQPTQPAEPADARAHCPRRRAPVRATVLPHAAHVTAWVRETATERAVAQMFNDFDLTNEESQS